MTMDEETLAPVLPEDKVYRWARERAEMLQGLYIHIAVFVVANLGLFGVTTPPVENMGAGGSTGHS